ncbi:hypothetical protein ACCS88_21240 [Rhizobium ruizarguesonis]
MDKSKSSGVIGYGRWQAYTWKKELALHSSRALQHFKEYLDDEFDGDFSPFDMLERAIVLSGFVMRRMMETRVVTDKLRASKIGIRCLPVECTEAFLRPWVSDTGPRRVGQYNFDSPGIVEMTIRDFGNEIIHASQLAIAYDFEEIEDGILIASDWHFKKRLLHVTPVEFKEVCDRVLQDEITLWMDGYEGYNPTGRIISIRE